MSTNRKRITDIRKELLLKNDINEIEKLLEEIKKKKEDANKELKYYTDLEKSLGISSQSGGGDSVFNEEEFWKRQYAQLDLKFT